MEVKAGHVDYKDKKGKLEPQQQNLRSKTFEVNHGYSTN